MDLLILGGTEFVGRAVTEDALARGWKVTLFHRGSRAASEGAQVLHGDRLAPGGLAALEEALAAGYRWDAVVDTWSAAPAAVRATTRLLAGHVERYAYVSSGSVYAEPQQVGADESAPVVEADPDATEAPYAEAKRGGELAVLEAFGDRAILGRAGLILGPWENVGRLPWWLGRIARGGTVLAPGPEDLSLQYIDARDLAAWLLDALAAGVGGAFNLIGPPGAATTGELLELCRTVTGSDASLRWTDPEPILAAGISPWMELPVWIPPGEDHDSFFGINVDRALATGLRIRPLAETVADTWSWLCSIGGTAPQRPDRPPLGLAEEKETALLRQLEAEER